MQFLDAFVFFITKFCFQVEETATNPARDFLKEEAKSQALELIGMKRKPIILHNNANRDLKVCFYGARDPLCAVPLGGISGYGVKVLKSGETHRVQTKDTKNGIISFSDLFCLI